MVIDCVYDSALIFSEELAGVKMNGKWGYINKESVLIIPCVYDMVHSCFEGLAAVEVNPTGTDVQL